MPVFDPGEGGSIYPEAGSGNQSQARHSAYHGRTYDAGDSNWLGHRPYFNGEQLDELQHNERTVALLLRYIFESMEPTDRCLRPPGDIWTVEREEEAHRLWEKEYGQ